MFTVHLGCPEPDAVDLGRHDTEPSKPQQRQQHDLARPSCIRVQHAVPVSSSTGNRRHTTDRRDDGIAYSTNLQHVAECRCEHTVVQLRQLVHVQASLHVRMAERQRLLSHGRPVVVA